MAHVRVCYREETYWVDNDGTEGSFPEDKFIEGDFKKVKWDGEKLILGRKTIITQSLSTYGINDIDYLEIDGEIYIEKRRK